VSDIASWSQVEAQAPELAATARRFFEAFAHKALATVRRDGSPRISGTEVGFARGKLWLGSMWRSMKALDLRRDPRFALHSGSREPPAWTGDAELAGRVEEITDQHLIEEINGGDAPGGRSHLFRADTTELVVVRPGEPPDHIVIDAWHQDRGLFRRERR